MRFSKQLIIDPLSNSPALPLNDFDPTHSRWLGPGIDNNIYGIYDININRFIFIYYDLLIIKAIAASVTGNVRVIDLTTASNWTEGLVDNDVCFAWTILENSYGLTLVNAAAVTIDAEFINYLKFYAWLLHFLRITYTNRYDVKITSSKLTHYSTKQISDAVLEEIDPTVKEQTKISVDKEFEKLSNMIDNCAAQTSTVDTLMFKIIEQCQLAGASSILHRNLLRVLDS